MNILNPHLHSILRGGCLVLLLLFLNSCSIVQVVVSFDQDSHRLRDGEREFELGNYQEAKAIFQEVLAGDGSEQTKNTARYNLACAKLITAKNDNEIQSAINSFDSWKKPYASGIYQENPILLVTALQQSKQLMVSSLASLERRVKQKDKTLQETNEELDELRATVLKLEHQIKELEAIDQQLQEKKKPL